MRKNKLLKFVLVSFLFTGIVAARIDAKVLLGIDVLEKNGFAELKGKRVGLITNQTGVDSKNKSTIDLLFNAKNVKLVALFSPEHGIRGTVKHGEKISDAKDVKTGLPIYSLYGKTQRPTVEMLKGIDVLVFDIQDIGTRFYTYTTTLALALEEAAKNKIEFVVLDRPNPITGAIVEGAVLSPDIKHFTAYLQIPTRHGMTAGEIANWYNKTANLGVKLKIIQMVGWGRSMWWDDTKLKFRPPSPNIKNLDAALLYPGMGAFEATNLSVGRGTKKPFLRIGAPWINAEDLRDRLEFLLIAGFEFRLIKFTPDDDLYKGQLCQGLLIKITDRNAARPVDLFFYMTQALRELYPNVFMIRWNEFERVVGSKQLTDLIKTNQSTEQILFFVHESSDKFSESAKPYLLYDIPPARNEKDQEPAPDKDFDTNFSK